MINNIGISRFHVASLMPIYLNMHKNNLAKLTLSIKDSIFSSSCHLFQSV
ncbi:hypothetical protein CSC18_1071 [Klebsiella aerogenes]|nr:hypothetical protein CSC18_1071 [Klebsiella aerogenes]